MQRDCSDELIWTLQRGVNHLLPYSRPFFTARYLFYLLWKHLHPPLFLNTQHLLPFIANTNEEQSAAAALINRIPR